MKRVGLWAVVAIVLATNVVILGRVAHNRSGEPEAVLQMTERELSLSYSVEENTEISLAVDYQRFRPFDENRDPGWFDQSKLEAVGYDCSLPLTSGSAERHYGKALPRTSYVVFEYDGDSWRAWLAAWERDLGAIVRQVDRGERAPEALKNAREQFEQVRKAGSRLLAVDAGSDPVELRRRYADRSRFLVAPAVVRLHFMRAWRRKDGTFHAPYLHGDVEHLLVDEIHVPREIRGLLDQLRRLEQQDERTARYGSLAMARHERMKQGPRYRVTLHVGHRLEPWIVDVRPLNEQG